MKPKRTKIFIAISSIALLIVLVIQVNWIVQAAANKEELFNEKANIILARTTEALSADKETCRNLESGKAGTRGTKIIDSLFEHYMDYYNFHVRYTFEVTRSLHYFPYVVKTENADSLHPGQACYEKSLNEMTGKNGWQLKLNFPESRKFIRTEMGIPFITSVVLILIVLVLFWRTVRSLNKEKKIAEHTTDFLNNMTHEFKTPLTNIALAGKMIIRDSALKENEKLKHYSEIILGENEKLKLQVEQVLGMTALERGEIPLQKAKLDFHQLINESLKNIAIQIENKEGKAIAKLNAVNFSVMGDKSHLTNVMRNLFDNAIKYANGKPELYIETFNTTGNLIVTVSDKGIGIEKEFQKKVFEKFFRVPTGNVHDVKGFGLGLAYVKKIIELHGGKVELESEAGKMTTFTITLPNA